MKALMKSLLVGFVVMVGSAAYAQVDEPTVSVCENLQASYSKILAAKDLVDSKNQYAKRIDSILESVENASIYQHCGFFKTVVAAKRVAVDINDAIMSCPGPSLLKSLIEASDRKLQPILTKEGSYRNLAHQKSLELITAIQTNITANCK
jgi:hypothetical protein